MANILIVDDTSFIRFILRKYFEKLGHIVVGEASCEKTAIKLYKERLPDIVTMNIVLENDDNGLNALKQIIKFDSNAKVIMISATGHSNIVEKAIEAGAKGYIVKPINGYALNQLLNKLINTSLTEAASHQ